jgi:PEGA domain
MNKYVLIILLIFLSTITAQDLNQLRIVDAANFLSNQLIDNDTKDNNGSVCAGLLIFSDIPGLTYDSNNGIVKVNHKDGEDFLFLSPTERVVKIYGPGFVPLQIILNDIGINLKSGQVWQIKITGDNKLDLIPINIITEPKDVQIIIDGIIYNPSTSIQMSEGKHQLVINKNGYKSLTKDILVTTSNTYFNYKLEKVSIVPVTVKSIPTGAKIYLNNIEKGTTDDQFFEYPGSYNVRLIKSGFLNYDQTIEISENGENIFSYNLTKNSGLINFEITPNDAEIRINTEMKTAKRIELIPGNHVVEISKSGYLSQTDTFKIEIGDSIFKNYKLIKNSGIIYFDLNPSDAEVRINSEVKNLNKVELIPGNYEIGISKVGYITQSSIVNLKLGDAITKKFDLVKNSSPLILDLNPSDVNVFINKKDYSGRKMIEIVPGMYQIEISKEGYYPINETIEVILGEPLTKTYSLKDIVGNLKFKIKPIDSRVILKRFGKVIEEWNGIRIVNNLKVGIYQLEAYAEGFKTHKSDISITDSKTIEKDIKLIVGSDIPLGDLKIVVTPSKAEVFLRKDGKTVGKWIGNKTLNSLGIGVYSIQVIAEGYRSQLLTVKIKDQKKEDIEVTLKKGIDLIPDKRIYSMSELPQDVMWGNKKKSDNGTFYENYPATLSGLLAADLLAFPGFLFKGQWWHTFGSSLRLTVLTLSLIEGLNNTKSSNGYGTEQIIIASGINSVIGFIFDLVANSHDRTILEEHNKNYLVRTKNLKNNLHEGFAMELNDYYGALFINMKYSFAVN